MSRSAGGAYTLPTGNPVVAGTDITVTWGNTTMTDIETELTDSLSRSGKGGMTAALALSDGTEASPGVAFSADANSGFYRIGADNIGMSLGGSKIIDYGTTGMAVTGTFSCSGLMTLTGGAVSGGDIISDTDSTDSLGSTGVRWAALWTDNITMGGVYAGATGTFSNTLGVTGVLTATAGVVTGSDIISDTDSTDNLGSTTVRWLKGWFDTLTAGTLTIGAGSIVDSSGAIDFGDEDLSTTGALGVGGLDVAGVLTFGTETTLTVATGAVTATKSFHSIDTEGAASTDDLETISGGAEGDVLVLKSVSTSRDIVIKDGAGNIRCAGDFNLGSSQDTMTLMYFNSFWHEVSRSNNVLTGTFTPIIADAPTAGNAGTPSAAVGQYTVINGRCFIDIAMYNIDTTGMTGGNNIYITDLPFTSDSTASSASQGSVSVALTTFGGSLTSIIFADTSALRIAESVSGAGLDYITIGELTSGTADVYASINYPIG